MNDEDLELTPEELALDLDAVAALQAEVKGLRRLVFELAPAARAPVLVLAETESQVMSRPK